MVKKLVLLLGLLLPAIICLAQLPDTSSVPPKPKISVVSNVLFQFDNRNERYHGAKGRMNGLKLGIEFYKRVRLGAGFYENNDYYFIPYPAIEDSAQRQSRFNYSTFFTEVVFYRNFRFEFSVLGSVGGGHIAVNNYNTTTAPPSYSRSDTISGVGVRDLSINGHYKIFPWLGLGLGIGYRNVHRLADLNLRTAYSDPYLDFKLKLFLSYAYKSIFKPEEIEMEKAYYDYRREQRMARLKTFFNR